MREEGSPFQGHRPLPEEAVPDEQQEGGDLKSGKNILDDASRPDPEKVHQRKKPDYGHRENDGSRPAQREEDADETGAGVGDSRNRSSLDGAEQGPAEEKTDPGREGFFEINHLPSGLGEHGAELGKAESAQEGDDAPQHPDQKQLGG